MRLIDADALILDYVYDLDNNYVADLDDIRNMQTVDAVPVVRCKECKYYLSSNEKCALLDTRLHFYETDKVWSSDCFCGWAERREI